jgi:hypothetical protein
MRRAAILAAIVAGCGDADGPGRCELVTAQSTLTAAERKLVGEASPYPADPLLRAREVELARSQRARRDAAWAAVARALEPVPLAEDLPAHDGPEALPRWHTWYGRDDLRRVFQRVWRGLPADDRAARAPIPDDALDAGFAWNPRAVDELDSWPEDRWRAYLDSLDDDLDVAGVGGIGRVGYAPAAARHLLASYAEQIDCLAGAPPPFVDGPPTPPAIGREPVALGACEARRFGPYFVAGGEALTARLDGDADAVVAVSGDASCEASTGEPCTIAGPGAVWIDVTSATAAVTGTLVVEHAAPDAPWAACLAGRFPVDAAVVKADWRRAELGFQVAVHDTSAAALRATLAGDADWGDGVGSADPGPSDLYTVRASSGNVYRLTALHLMTRELDHWLWVTLWWSPDPDSDFGADRPPAIARLGGPWRNYKMCAAVAFTEGDPDPRGGLGRDHPDLAAALAATYAGAGAPSWCSNPYLEVGHGNAATNCVGCHQHGGTGLAPRAILDELPAHGRTQLRNNFPADYAWSTDRGDRLAEMLRDEVEYWDDVP